MKFNPLSLVIAFFAMLILSAIPVQAQKVSTKKDKSVIQQLYDHDHKKCGMDAVTDRLIQDNPDYARELRDFKNNVVPALSKMGYDRSAAPIIYVPVVVHVIHNGEAIGTGANLSDERIQAQIDVLNLDFSAMNSNYNDTPAQWQDDVGNPEIQFCLAIIDPDGNGTTGITRHNIAVTGTNSNNSNIEDEIKPATWWNSDEYYNIYTVGIPGTTAGGGTTGYAYLPTGGAVGEDIDGSVVDYRWFGGPGFSQSGYGTLTHETGHYLGLPHPFSGEDCGADDNIDDTPNIDAPTSDYSPSLNCSPGNFPAGPVSCTNEHMYVNFMDYVNDDDCSTSFTIEQINVMRNVLEGTPPGAPFNYVSRLPLAQNATTVCTFFDNDAGIAAIKEPTKNMCGNAQVTPVVTLQNYGRLNLNTVTISYQVNGGTPVDFIWIDVLETGGTQDVSLAPFTPPAGTYTFSATVSLPNGVADEQTSNDEKEVSVTTVIPTNLPLAEGFEDAQWDPTVNGVFQLNITEDGFTWERSTATSGFGMGSGSAVFDNYASSGGSNPNGTSDALITSVYDFTNITAATLSFDVAYAPYDDSFFDSLKVYASTDCGSTFDDLLFSNGNTGLATAAATTGLFTPSSAEWATHNIDLSAYDNMDNLTIAIINQSGYGNRLFIDNINITSASACSMTLESITTDVTCNGSCNGAASVNPVDGTPTYTYQWDANAGNATTASVDGLCFGEYSVTVTDSEGCTAETIVIIMEPVAMDLGIITSNETAFNANDGTAIANISGGTQPYTYLWDDPLTQTTITATNLAPGTYCVIVADAEGCEIIACGIVEEYDCSSFSVSVETNDVDCFGNENGSVIATGSSGTEPYTYLWSTTDETAEVTNLAAGTYTVTATDASGCTNTAFGTINEPNAIDLSATATDEMSVGANDGTATATSTGGSGPFTYEWNDPSAQITQTITGLAPGTYCVTVTDDTNCTATTCVTVNEFGCGSLNLSLNSTDVICFGFGNGSIISSVENGNAPYTYLWNTGAETENLENISPGTYTLTVTDNTGCTAVESVQITEPDFLSVSVVCTSETAPGANDGTCSVAVSGGTCCYTESWSNGGSGVTISDLAPGIYCVTVTDDQGCTEESCGTVNGLSCNMTIDISTTNVTCNGADNGAAEVVIAGGTAPFQIAWSSGETDIEIVNGLSAGSYSITVVDDLNCEQIGQFTITEPDVLTLTIGGTNPSSGGASDGTASAMPEGGTPGYNFIWDTGSNAQTITGLSAGVYVVTVTDLNSCMVVNEIELVDPSVDCAGFSGQITSTDAFCFGEDSGSAAVFVNGGMPMYQYLWSNNGETTQEIFGLTAGVYTVTVTDMNDCELILTTQVLEYDLLTIEMTGTNPSAPGANDGIASAMGMGGLAPYGYNWSGGQTTPNITNVPAGIYVVTIVDANGCTAINEIELTDPSVDCAGFSGQITSTDVFCNGEDSGSAAVFVNGGTPAYQYAWSNGGNTQEVAGLTAGVYTVTVTDIADCELIFTVEILEPDVLTVQMTSTPPSTPGGNDGTITAMGIGGVPGYTYSWASGQSTPTLTNVSQGIYNITVTDSNGCTVQESGIVQDPVGNCNDVTISVDVIDVTCNGGSNGILVATAEMGTAPISYVWSNGVMNNVNSGLTAGTYSVTATDAAGCIASTEVLLSEPSAIEIVLTATAESGLGANDGAISSSVSGGVPVYAYEWSNGEETPDISGLAAGMYSLTIIDSNDCAAIMTVVVGIDGVDCSTFSIVDFEATAVTCFGDVTGVATVITTGGTAPITYNWSNGMTGQTIENLSAGLYVITATDASGCVSVNEIEIEQPDTAIDVDFTVTSESAAGAADGAIDVTVTGGTPNYTYEWDNGALTEDLNNLSVGVYDLTVTDENACTESVTIVVPVEGGDCDDFELETEFQNITCNGAADGLIVVTATGGQVPILYSWNTGATTQSLFDLVPGIYTVTVTDGNDCEAIEQFFITEPAPITLTVTTTNETMVGANDGTAVAVASGGTGGFTYDWTNGETTSSISDLEPGDYTITVTDMSGCTAMETIEIEAFSDFCSNFEGTIESTSIDCAGNNIGTVTTMVTGGLLPYNYIWSNGANFANLNSLSGGTYTVTITDGNDCELILTAEVGEPSELTAEVIAYNGACGTAGIVSPIVSGGTQPYAYNWSNGSTDEFISGLDDGLYSLTITDANGCTVTGEAQIENDEGGIEIESDVEPITCSGDANGAIEITTLTGAAPFTFTWNTGATTEDLESLEAGTYTVLITDALGCSFLTTFNVADPAGLTASINSSPANNGDNGTASAVVYGGTTPYTYEWNTGANTPSIENLNVGVYDLTVTDANGCTTETSVNIGTTALDELSTLESLIVSPNPSNGQFVINAAFSTFETGMVEAYNILGQRIFADAFSGTDLTLDIGLLDQPEGSYFLVLSTEQGRAVRKLIIVR